MINVPKITYIISYRHTQERLTNLRRVLEWLAPFQGLEIILVEQDTHSKISELNLKLKHIFIKSDMPFNKSWGFNVGVKYSNTPIVIMGDSDLIMNPNEFIAGVQMIDNYEAVSPYKSVVDLNPQESLMDINSILSINRIGRGEAENDIEKVPLCGGIIMFKREAYIKVGGFCEDFLGWGAEDDHMSIKVKKFLTFLEMPYKCYHLYHEKSRIDQKLYQRNIGILNHFANATKKQLQTHINMVSPKIAHINKYS